jgi:hypothetical protein
MHTTYDTLTVGQAQRIVEISKSDDEDKDVQYVSLLTGLTREDVYEMTLPEFNSICREAAKVFTDCKPGKPQRSARVGKGRYTIIYNARDLTSGDYISIQTWLKEGVVDNMHRIFACLLKPKLFTKKPPHPELSEQIQEMNFKTVQASCVFFSTLYNASIKALAGYLESEMKTMQTEAKTTLRAALDGYTMLKW